MEIIKNYWAQLEAREKLVLGWGGLLVFLILFYALLLQPLYKAIAYMEGSIQLQRENLVWIRQQSELIKNGGVTKAVAVRGAGQSLMSVVEQTAKSTQVRDAIQQMVPGQNESEVRVVLEGANFNRWVTWIDVLFQQYGVTVEQVSAEREEDKPNVAEIRVTFQRN